MHRAAAITAALAILATGAQAQTRSFNAEGTDTALGVGARHLAMGGTGASTADDAHAIYYNPALLADFDRAVVSGTVQLGAELRPYTFIGAVLPLDVLDPLGLNVTLGAARYPRVHARSSGAFAADEAESVFLRLLLPSVSGTFDGDIDSKTMVNRFALGLSHEALPQLRLGFNLDWIDCKTNTCGVHGTSAGIETQSVHATALSYGVSAALDLTDRLTLAASYTDIDTTLDIDFIVTDDNGTRQTTGQADLPSQIKLGASYTLNQRWRFAAEYQRVWGAYGSYDNLSLATLHGGVEYSYNDWLTLRGGAFTLLTMETPNGLTAEMPFPFAPTLGAGARWGGLDADVALYAHPVQSLHENTPAITADVSVSYRF